MPKYRNRAEKIRLREEATGEPYNVARRNVDGGCGPTDPPKGPTVARVVTVPATWDLIITASEYWGLNADTGLYEYYHFVIWPNRLSPPSAYLNGILREEGWVADGPWPDPIKEGTKIRVLPTPERIEDEQHQAAHSAQLRILLSLTQFAKRYEASERGDDAAAEKADREAEEHCSKEYAALKRDGWPSNVPHPSDPGWEKYRQNEVQALLERL